MWVAAFLLLVPLAHQVKSHNAHRRFARLFRPEIQIPLTVHEQHHAARPRPLRLAADVGWLLFIVLVVWASAH
jgi:hypothetical protein